MEMEMEMDFHLESDRTQGKTVRTGSPDSTQFSVYFQAQSLTTLHFLIKIHAKNNGLSILRQQNDEILSNSL
jgi:hypothetical protein